MGGRNRLARTVIAELDGRLVRESMILRQEQGKCCPCQPIVAEHRHHLNFAFFVSSIMRLEANLKTPARLRMVLRCHKEAIDWLAMAFFYSSSYPTTSPKVTAWCCKNGRFQVQEGQTRDEVLIDHAWPTW